MAQLEGSGRGSLASYNAPGYEALRDSISDLSTMDCNAWLKQLAQRDRMIGAFSPSITRKITIQHSVALRVCEVRSAYCEHDFEWENCKRVTLSTLEEDNLTLMRDVLETSFDGT